jgi:hypothetical protein
MVIWKILRFLKRLNFKYQIKFYTVIQNFGFPLDNFYGSFEFKKFTQNFGFSNRNFGFFNRNFVFFELKFRVFEPKHRVFSPKIRVFRTEISGFWTETSCFWSFVFLNQSCSFCKEFCFVLLKLWVLIPEFLRPKLRNIKSIRSFGKFGSAETGEILEVSGENELLFISQNCLLSYYFGTKAKAKNCSLYWKFQGLVLQKFFVRIFRIL